MSDLLFELGIEEVPTGDISSILDQLQKQFHKKLAENAIKFNTIEAAASNRRFMIYVPQIGDRADAKLETIIGPAKKIALDEQGQPTLALQKFMEFNQVMLADLVEIETAKGLYFGLKKTSQGKKTAELACQFIPQILAELQFSKAMVWNESRVPFIRPIKNILALLNGDLLEIEFAGIKSSNKVRGHFMLSDEDFEVSSFKDYIEGLDKNFVILYEGDRRQKIASEIAELEDEIEAHIPLLGEMLDYYVYNNEYPVIFCGSFAEKYLSLPQEVLSTFMIREKKLLPVFDRNGKLLPQFIGVANIPDENKKVSQGNEKVIQATFEDAQFFWDRDRKDNFGQHRAALKNVLFQEDVGTYFDKTERLQALVELLAQETQNGELAAPLRKAATLCKNDLLTRMVREFPSLQGIMGGLYLRESGESEEVWRTVYGHYQPRGFTDEKLDSKGAGLLSIADRLDSLAGFISKGFKISGSKDPYGMRRDSNAIIKIILDFQFAFDLKPVIAKAVANFASDPVQAEELSQTLNKLFLGRLENTFKDILKFRYDVVNAVLNEKALNVLEFQLKADALTHMARLPVIDQLIALHKRLKNIIRQHEVYPFSEALLVQKEEKLLYEIFREAKGQVVDLIIKRDYRQAGEAILEMNPVINSFFEAVLVMADDEKLRQNRLALLQRIDELLSGIADFSLIVESSSGGK